MEVINTFKSFYLVDRVPKALGTEVHNIVQEPAIKTITKKKMQEGKMIVWEGFINSWGNKKSKKQGRKGKIYPTECRGPENSKKRQEGLLQWTMQRSRGKWKNGQTRDLFKKIGDIKGTNLARMGMIKDRNGKDLTEAEQIKKRWQEYTELYQKKS